MRDKEEILRDYEEFVPEKSLFLEVLIDIRDQLKAMLPKIDALKGR